MAEITEHSVLHHHISFNEVSVQIKEILREEILHLSMNIKLQRGEIDIFFVCFISGT